MMSDDEIKDTVARMRPEVRVSTYNDLLFMRESPIRTQLLVEMQRVFDAQWEEILAAEEMQCNS